MSLNIIVLFPSGRRRNTKVSPNSVISQSLEEVCLKENLDAEKYAFLFQRKILDESLSWRYANVPNNAKLELVKQEKTKQEIPVRIALQYEGGPRLQGPFLPSTTLSEILDHWKNEFLNLTPPEGQEPSILYLRQEITGNAKLSTTSLKSLGLLSGSAILRLSFKPVTHIEEVKKVVNKKIEPRRLVKETQPTMGATALLKTQKVPSKPANQGIITQEMLQDALRQVSAPETEEKMDIETAESMETSDNVPNSSKNGRVRPRRPNSSDTMPKKKVKQTSPPSPQQPDFGNFKFPEETAGMDVYMSEETVDIDIQPLMQPCDREVMFFDEKEIENREIVTDDPGDDFYELTIDDIRKMISELRALQTESEDKPLVTSRSREMQRLRSINQYPKIIIRIAFPNRQIIQGIFRPAETIETLHNFVKSFLASQNVDFYLYTTPPKVVLKDKKSILYDNHLAPASKVYFGLKNGDFDPGMLSRECEKHRGSAADANLKLGSIFEMKSPMHIKDQPNYDFSSSSGQTSNSVQENNAPSTSRQQTSTSQVAHPSGARPKVPKWFKIGK